MDVKPENIGLLNRVFVLLDLGSTAPFGDRTEVTELFVPVVHGNADFEIVRGSMLANAQVDKWMLAMTFFMKLVSHDGTTRETQSAVCHALSRASVWPQLSEFLGHATS